MSNMSTTAKIAIVAGSAAAVVGLGYLLMKRRGSAKGGRRAVDTITKDQVIEIIDEIAEAQNQMRKITQNAISEVLAKKLTFDETFELCLRTQPADPLRKYNLTTGDFDNLLDREQHDPHVRQKLAKIMGLIEAGDGAVGSAKPIKPIDVSKLISIHQFMLDELNKVAVELEPRMRREAIDMRALAIAAQVLVGAKVQEKFSVETDDIEAALIQHHETLSNDKKFGVINEEIQSLMAKFFDIQPM